MRSFRKVIFFGLIVLQSCRQQADLKYSIPGAVQLHDQSVVMVDDVPSLIELNLSNKPIRVLAILRRSWEGASIGLAIGSKTGRYSVRWQGDGMLVAYRDDSDGAPRSVIAAVKLDQVRDGIHELGFSIAKKPNRSTITVDLDGAAVLTALVKDNGILSWPQRISVLTGDDLGKLYSLRVEDAAGLAL